MVEQFAQTAEQVATLQVRGSAVEFAGQPLGVVNGLSTKGDRPEQRFARQLSLDVDRQPLERERRAADEEHNRHHVFDEVPSREPQQKWIADDTGFDAAEVESRN